jgi:tellurite methyltransferase
MSSEIPSQNPEKMCYCDMTKPSEKVVELANILKSGDALDLGAGQGRNSIYLAKNGFNVTAVENEHSQIEILQKKNEELQNKVQIVNADIREYNLEQQYDAIISNMVLHFMPQVEVDLMIKKMQQMTKIGGYNVVVEHSDKNPPGSRPYQFKHNELPDRWYKDWEIISYEEKSTPLFSVKGDPAPRRKEAVYLIARKTKSERETTAH